ncbi:hypothetical protein J7315_01000 [Providencia rettgeri]|uniref:tail fiber/spike domain-containing protein n=1 Tax=Providencia rettgeri TaxID=587 RepID=UPI001B36A169|nr:hypothetical protein [Providencia rettgeri]MBQ0684660.1 hypothetical protein [Providencia rettgeri]
MREVKPTQKPVPSSDIKDLFFNSGLLDIWATSLEPKYIDRFGNCHLTAAGMEWLFKELVEKFKVDMNTAIVAAGYITIDSFQQGADLPNNELTQRNHILRDETTGEYYRWDGDLPKQVPAGSTPQSTGGVGKGAWVSVGDASLRSDLLKDTGASLVRASAGKSVQDELDDIKDRALESEYRSLSNIRILKEIPVRPTVYTEIKNKYSYKDIYPQGMFFFDEDREVYIINSSEGGNGWAWVYVYDADTFSLKSVFSAGNDYPEGLFVTKIANVKYLITLEGSAEVRGAGSTGVYILPNKQSVDMKRLSPVRVCNTNQLYQMSGFADTLVIEVSNNSKVVNSPQRRTKFNYYNVIDLINSDNPVPIGAMSMDYNSTRVGKRQGVALSNNGLITSHGSYFYPETIEFNSLQMYSVNMLNFDGTISQSFVAHPQKILDAIKDKLKVLPKRLENEGVAYSKISGEYCIYTMTIAGSPSSSDEFSGGLVILEQNAPANGKDVISIKGALSLDGLVDRYNDTSIQISEVPFDRLQNKRLESLRQILDRMNRDDIQTLRFYNGQEPYIKDINGNEITPFCSVLIENMNSYSYLVSVVGSRTNYQMWITGEIGGPYTQRVNTYIQSVQSTPRPEFLINASRIGGVDGTVREDIYTKNNGRVAVSRFYSGENHVPSGSIIVDGGSNKTDYVTTSDERLKVDLGEYSDGLIKILNIQKYNALRKYRFKNSDISQYGFMAQRLLNAVPAAVSYQEDVDEYGVAYAAIIPDLVSAIIELSKKIEDLERKINGK